MEFVATCPKGLEQLLAAELASLGLERVRALTGQVSFEGTLSSGYRACLWSRIASRVIAVLARLDATDADALYEGAAAIAWEDHVPRGASVAVDAHGTNDNLRNTQFVALRTKDAVADRMLARAGVRVRTDPASPDLRIACRLHENRAAVGIDLSGEPLFRRGYEAPRGARGQVPQLRADFAAALLAHGLWYRSCRHEAPGLVVGLAGGGALAAEGLAQALDRAPGLLRSAWGFDGWLGHDAAAWQRLSEEAARRAAEAEGREVGLVCCDSRRGWESAVRRTLRAAGMDVSPTLVSAGDAEGLRAAVAELGPAPLAAVDATLTDPDDLAQQASVLACASAVAGALPDDATLVALSADGTLDAAVRATCAGPVGVLYARGEATLRSYDLASRKGAPALVEVSEGRSVPVLVPASDQFAARLAKMRRHLGKWARREGVTCYRVYDADLPDYAVSIDLFEGVPRPSRAAGGQPVPSGRWCVVSEYAAPAEVDPELARKRLLDVLAIVPGALGVAPADTHVRVRTHSKGGSQYAGAAGRDAGARGERGRRRPKLVEEGGLTFEVNFDDYLDCGIFLDHRETRAMVRELAKAVPEGGRFCNLFAYTGTATCYAADGGCSDTTTVDLSRTYLDWAGRNLRRNGFTEETHRLVQADVIDWVNRTRHGRERYDLVFCDPPTFSNSSRMRKRSFEVQRDHVELLIGVSRILAPNGVCLFSCNLRDFRPDVERLARAGVSIEDVTEQTIPEDFARNPKVHHCYLVRRVPRPKGEEGRDEHRHDSRPGHGPGARRGQGGHGGPRGGRGGEARGDRPDRGGRDGRPGARGGSGGHGRRDGAGRDGRRPGGAGRPGGPGRPGGRPQGGRPHGNGGHGGPNRPRGNGGPQGHGGPNRRGGQHGPDQRGNYGGAGRGGSRGRGPRGNNDGRR